MATLKLEGVTLQAAESMVRTQFGPEGNIFRIAGPSGVISLSKSRIVGYSLDNDVPERTAV